MRTQVSGYISHEWMPTKINVKSTHLEDLANTIEEPSMGIDLLLIFSFQNKDDLNGDQVVWVFAVGQH